MPFFIGPQRPVRARPTPNPNHADLRRSETTPLLTATTDEPIHTGGERNSHEHPQEPSPHRLPESLPTCEKSEKVEADKVSCSVDTTQHARRHSSTANNSDAAVAVLVVEGRPLSLTSSDESAKSIIMEEDERPPTAIARRSSTHSNVGTTEVCIQSDKSSQENETPFLAHVAEHYDEAPIDPSAPFYWRAFARLSRLIPRGSIAATIFNFVAATIGAGVLGLPQAMQQCGLVLGCFLLLLVCACTVFSIRLLIQLFDATGLMTYEELAKRYIHPRFGDKLAAAVFVAFCWGTTVVYVVTMSDIFSKIAEVSWIPEFFRTSIGHKLAVSLYWLVVFLPLSICKEVNSLRYVSFAGILATLYLVAIIVVTEGETGTQTVAAQTPLFAFNTPMLAALPVFIFSYCCQVNAFEIYTELKPRTVTRLSRSVIIAMLVCTLIYGSAGVAGALNFGTAVHGNILKNYSIKSSVSILLTYVGVAINLASSYPLCIYPTRDAIVQMLGYPSAYATPTHKRILLCVVLATLSLIAGLFAPGIQLLFGLLGGICGSSVGFIFPSLFAIRSGLFSRDRAGWLQWICIWLLLAFGVGSCIFGTAISILQTVQTAGDS